MQIQRHLKGISNLKFQLEEAFLLIARALRKRDWLPHQNKPHLQKSSFVFEEKSYSRRVGKEQSNRQHEALVKGLETVLTERPLTNIGTKVT